MVPPVLGRLTNLKSLDLSDNDIRVLPVEVGNLTRLEWLSLAGNPLELPYSAVRREPYGDLAIVSFLDRYTQELDLSGCGFEEMPSLVFRHADYLQVVLSFDVP
jgi:hypothetical protein